MFNNCPLLTEITIPASVKTIGECAFGWGKISKLTFVRGSLLESIGRNAFNSSPLQGVLDLRPCTKLTTIGEGAFQKCTMTDLYLPASVTKLGVNAFNGCGSLKTVDFNFTDANFDWDALVSGTQVNATDNRTFGGSTSAKGYYFDEVKSTPSTLQNLTMESKSLNFITGGIRYTEYADGYWVVGYTGNAGEVVIPTQVKGKKVTRIDNEAFAQKDGEGKWVDNTILTSIVVGDNVESIGDDAFRQCKALTSVTLSQSLTTLGNRCFIDCAALKSITLPKSLTTVEGAYHFQRCKDLSKVDFEKGSKLTSISNYMFASCPFTNITIPASVKTIGEGAFAWLPLTKVNFEEGSQLTTMGKEAFRGCKNLASIVIPRSLTTLVGASQFNNCDKLAKVIFEEGSQLTSISAYMFNNCPLLTEITIPASVKTIGECAFGWGKISSLSFEKGSLLESIGKDAFNRSPLQGALDLRPCTKLTTIGYAAFRDATFDGVLDLTPCKSLTTISDFAFRSCQKITMVFVPASVKTIGGEAFNNTTAMTALVLNATDWNGIKDWTFDDGSNIRTIYYRKGMTNLSAHAQAGSEGHTRFVAVDPIELTTAGYATYYNSKAFVLPPSLEAAVITNAAGGHLTYSWDYAATDEVPAGTGVVIRGDAGSYVPVLGTTTATVSYNLLRGSDDDALTTGGDKYYRLSLDSNLAPESIGFYYGEADGKAFTNGAHKAYLALTNSQAQNVKAFRLDGTFDDGGVTGINDVVTGENTHNDAVYTLQGVRINKPVQGINIINHKKVIVK